VVTKGYKPKGDYITVDGLKTCKSFPNYSHPLLHNTKLPHTDATGPKDAKRGILVIYDIFGFFNQTLQGADILAYSDAEHPYQVFMPDFFEGKPADISWYPPDNKDKEQKLGEFFKTQAAPPKTLPRVPKIVEELGNSRGVESWGVVGFCWGGKVCLRVFFCETMKTKWTVGRLLSCLLITDLDVASG
jgi:hypothetical protein